MVLLGDFGKLYVEKFLLRPREAENDSKHYFGLSKSHF
jgi:hypothetical protein